MSTALAKLATNVGVTETEITEVVKGMIISAKKQHGAVASNAELTVVAGICSTYGLNPLVREAHAFISSGKLQVVIGIDGWVKIMNRQPDFNGVEFIDTFEGKDMVSITTKIHVKGRDFPVCITEYMDECYQSTSDAWKKYSKRMLRNKSLGQCVRVAFGISEVIDDDEAGRIRSNTPAERDITPKPSVNFTDINIIMAECGDLDTLKSACGSIKQELQTNGMWDSVKAEIIALNIKHKDRINADYNSGTKSQETKSSAAQAIEGELLSAGDGVTSSGAANVDTAFGDDEDDIGFGDETDGSFETVTDEFGG